MSRSINPRALAASGLLILAFLLIYLPDIGHGFVRDDFMWVRAGQIESAADVTRILGENTGFYRPLVTLSFGVDRLLFGLSPLPYALTNLALLFASAALVARLARRLGLRAWPAGAAAAMWAFNVHGVNMALLWISGRTALLLCCCALGSALASLRGRWWQSGVWCLLALLSKEEAIALPFLLTWWGWYSSGDRGARQPVLAVFRQAAPLFLAIVVYALLRWNSGAFGPASAPSYYQLTFAPLQVLRNVFEYADRSLTFFAAAALVTLAMVRARPAWQPRDRHLALFALAWLVTGFAITVFLPVRSSLYVLCPSIGSALAAALLLERLHDAAPRRMHWSYAALVLLPFLLLPIYRERNQRWVIPADASHVMVSDLVRLAPNLPPATHIVALDTADQRLDSVFSGLFADAVTLFVGGGATGEMVAAGGAAQGGLGREREVLRVQPDGHLSPAAGDTR